jgi:CRP/FNR family cyclic AMP-dependent transcriptional regulator
MLSTVALFDGLREEDRDELSSMMTKKVFARNQLIISQGDHTRSLFVILSGRLKVFVNDELGNQTVFAFLQQGDYCGELSLLDAEPRSASIITLVKTEVLQLSYQQFDIFLQSHPQVYSAIFKSLTASIREMDGMISALTSKDIYGRLVHVLHKESHEETGRLVTQRLTHQDIAEMIGASREMVTRILNELRKGGYISIESKQICIEKKLPAGW